MVIFIFEKKNPLDRPLAKATSSRGRFPCIIVLSSVGEIFNIQWVLSHVSNIQRKNLTYTEFISHPSLQPSFKDAHNVFSLISHWRRPTKVKMSINRTVKIILRVPLRIGFFILSLKNVGLSSDLRYRLSDVLLLHIGGNQVTKPITYHLWPMH